MNADLLTLMPKPRLVAEITNLTEANRALRGHATMLARRIESDYASRVEARRAEAKRARHAENVAEALAVGDWARAELRRIGPDPDAALHRAQLLEALR